MPGRIGRAFEKARRERRGAFVPFLTSGCPDLSTSLRLARAIGKEGADVLELGVPFSDPVADGPTIQRATQTALRGGATLASTIELARALRSSHPDLPLVLMSYLNPIVRFGPERFAKTASDSGVDGLILVDLPPEEDRALWDVVRSSGLETILLVSPTTEPARLPGVLAGAEGFIYVVARLGVTGRGEEDRGIRDLLARCREMSSLPRCLGFGIGPNTALAKYRGLAEGVVVGSALLDAVAAERDPRSAEEAVRRFARAMRERLRELAPGGD